MTRRELNLTAALVILLNLYCALNTPVIPQLNWVMIGWVAGIWWFSWQIRRSHLSRRKGIKWREIGKGIVAVIVSAIPLLAPIVLASQDGWSRGAWIGGLLWGLLCVPGALLSINWLYRDKNRPKVEDQ